MTNLSAQKYKSSIWIYPKVGLSDDIDKSYSNECSNSIRPCSWTGHVWSVSEIVIKRMIVWKDDLHEKLWRSLNLSNIIFKGEWYSGFSCCRDQLISDGENFFVMEAAASSCQCIQASSEFLPKVDTSDIADQQQLDLQPFDQALLTSIVESYWNIWRNYGHLVGRLGSCVLNQLDILGWYKDWCLDFFSNCWHITRGKSSGVGRILVWGRNKVPNATRGEAPTGAATRMVESGEGCPLPVGEGLQHQRNLYMYITEKYIKRTIQFYRW